MSMEAESSGFFCMFFFQFVFSVRFSPQCIQDGLFRDGSADVSPLSRILDVIIQIGNIIFLCVIFTGDAMIRVRDTIGCRLHVAIAT